MLSKVIFFLYDGDDNIIGMNFDGEFYYYQKNVLGDVTAVYDSNGVCVAEYEYDAWGNVIYQSGGQRDGLAIDYINPIRYRSYYYERSVGMYYLQSRYYYATAGRFINADDPKIALATKNSTDGTNLFVYCNNDPVNNVDPIGCYSGIIVYYYKPKSKKLSSSMFGHLDIRIDNMLYSYANYSSGNLLITKNIKKYHNHQRKKYIINSCSISVTKGKKSDILYFYKHQKRISTYKAKASFDISGKSKIYKINSGKYKKYNLTSVNCSTFVLDGLNEAFSMKITLYRIIQMLCYPFQDLDTPKKVFELCTWLAN